MSQPIRKQRADDENGRDGGLDGEEVLAQPRQADQPRGGRPEHGDHRQHHEPLVQGRAFAQEERGQHQSTEKNDG